MRRVECIVMVAGVIASVAGCASAEKYGLTPSPVITTTTPGATENWFRLEWDVTPDAGQTKRVDGYVYNNYGRPAAFMQLLVQAFDNADNLIDQRLDWVGSPVPPLSRSYFSIRRLPTADRYRVSVWSYTIQRGGGAFRSDWTVITSR
jgi:hypothetical protein